MADKDEHSKSDEQEMSVGQTIMAAAAKEMGFAVDSIRQEVVEKGWFGEKVTPQHTISDTSPQIEQGSEIEQDSDEKEFSWGDLYGRDSEGMEPEPDHELERDQGLER